MTVICSIRILDSTFKGFPHGAAPLRRSQVGAQGWDVLAGDLPAPLALVRRPELEHNLGWMQRYADGNGVRLVPHGKTTMSPQLLRRQLDAGAWGLTFANVTQLQAGLAAGARRLLIANQVLDAVDLGAIAALQDARPDVRVIFLLDSPAQLALIEGTSPGSGRSRSCWRSACPAAAPAAARTTRRWRSRGARTRARRSRSSASSATRACSPPASTAPTVSRPTR